VGVAVGGNQMTVAVGCGDGVALGSTSSNGRGCGAQAASQITAIRPRMARFVAGLCPRTEVEKNFNISWKYYTLAG